MFLTASSSNNITGNVLTTSSDGIYMTDHSDANYIFNNTLETISRANVSILLFERDRNIIGASRTIVENLQPGETREISFSWPEEIKGTIDSIEGHVRVNQLSRLPQ